MNQSILISGGNVQERLDKAYELAGKFLKVKTAEVINHPDFTQIVPELVTGIGISQIRELIKTLLLKPLLAPFRVAIIPSAALLTLEAQNAFLKTLEEPPEKVIIILCVRDINLLLPTIVSRCQVITLAAAPEIELANDESKDLTKLVTQLSQFNLGQKFFYAEKFGQSREEGLLFLDKITIITNNLLLDTLEKPDKSGQNLLKYKNFLGNIAKTKTFIQSNVNPRFALENLFLSC